MEKSFVSHGDKVSSDENFIRFEASTVMLSAEELQALGLIQTFKKDEAVSDDDVEQLCGLVHDGYYGSSRSTFKSQQRDLPCEMPDVTKNRSKRLSDEDMKRDAYATSHDEMTSFACTSSCSFQCAQKITFSGQRQQFLDYWGPKESKDTVSTKQRKANLGIYMKKAYDKEKKTFRFFTVKSDFVPSYEICEYAAAHCLCINPHTSRIWETSKTIAKKAKYDSLGKEISDSDIDGNIIVILFAKTNTDSNLCRNTSPLESEKRASRQLARRSQRSL